MDVVQSDGACVLLETRLLGHQVSSKIDYCPFSVRLIAHEVSGRRGDYRNHAAVTKAEAQDVALWFRGCFSHDNLLKVAGKPFQKAAVVFVLGFFFF